MRSDPRKPRTGHKRSVRGASGLGAVPQGEGPLGLEGPEPGRPGDGCQVRPPPEGSGGRAGPGLRLSGGRICTRGRALPVPRQGMSSPTHKVCKQREPWQQVLRQDAGWRISSLRGAELPCSCHAVALRTPSGSSKTMKHKSIAREPPVFRLSVILPAALLPAALRLQRTWLPRAAGGGGGGVPGGRGPLCSLASRARPACTAERGGL